jgi:hypothetical protein
MPVAIRPGMMSAPVTTARRMRTESAAATFPDVRLEDARDESPSIDAIRREVCRQVGIDPGKFNAHTRSIAISAAR